MDRANIRRGRLSIRDYPSVSPGRDKWCWLSTCTQRQSPREPINQQLASFFSVCTTRCCKWNVANVVRHTFLRTTSSSAWQHGYRVPMAIPWLTGLQATSRRLLMVENIFDLWVHRKCDRCFRSERFWLMVKICFFSFFSFFNWKATGVRRMFVRRMRIFGINFWPVFGNACFVCVICLSSLKNKIYDSFVMSLMLARSISDQ